MNWTINQILFDFEYFLFLEKKKTKNNKAYYMNLRHTFAVWLKERHIQQKSNKSDVLYSYMAVCCLFDWTIHNSSSVYNLTKTFHTFVKCYYKDSSSISTPQKWDNLDPESFHKSALPFFDHIEILLQKYIFLKAKLTFRWCLNLKALPQSAHLNLRKFADSSCEIMCLCNRYTLAKSFLHILHLCKNK